MAETAALLADEVFPDVPLRPSNGAEGGGTASIACYVPTTSPLTIDSKYALNFGEKFSPPFSQNCRNGSVDNSLL